jgi:hypothetical protein
MASQSPPTSQTAPTEADISLSETNAALLSTRLLQPSWPASFCLILPTEHLPPKRCLGPPPLLPWSLIPPLSHSRMTSRNPAEVGASVSLTSRGIAGEGKRCLKELDDNRVWGGREGEEYRRREEGQQSLEVWSHGDGGRGMLKGTGEPKSVRALGERTFLSSFFHDQQISRILSTR